MDVTVITPTISERHLLLQQCIDSVRNQIEPVKDHLWMIDSEAYGPSYVRNELVKEARTQWVAFLDDDDLLYPNHFLLHAPYQNNADVIFSWGDQLFEDGRRVLLPSRYDPDTILSGNNTIPVTATVRKSVFEAVGGFSLSERLEDWALWRDLIGIGARFQCIQQVTWDYRIFPNGRNSQK